MFPAHNFVAIVSVFTITLTIFAEGRSGLELPCKRCMNAKECNEEPPIHCVYGENRNACGKRVCLKGPGEKCGGAYNIRGTCGEGLWCNSEHNRCHGASIMTMEAYPM